MNDDIHDPMRDQPYGEHDDERIRWALRGLRRDQAPQRDLWPQVATRIAAHSNQPQRARSTRFAPFALAASLLLAIGIGWQLWPARPAPVAGPGLVRTEARAMTREYAAALQEIQVSSAQPESASVAELPALRELDRSAAQIRTALRRDPDARFLLDRLRHTYTLRLALTQRVALG